MDASEKLVALGRTIIVRIQKAEKAATDSDNHFLAAGLHLKEAKSLLETTQEMSWGQFLKIYCGIGRSRADELVAIADGKATLEGLRSRKRRSSSATYRKYRASHAASSGNGTSPASGGSEPRATTTNRTTKLALALQVFDELNSAEQDQFCAARHLKKSDPLDRLNTFLCDASVFMRNNP